jgi:predicted RNase H-like nuclease
VCKGLTGKGISQQAWALGKKIIQVDPFAQQEPERIREGHPEVTFWTLNEHEPLRYSKRSWNGLMQRRRLLQEAGIQLPDALGAAGEMASDDVLDATALAWTANRIASGHAASIPTPPHNEDGRQVAIWY